MFRGYNYEKGASSLMKVPEKMVVITNTAEITVIWLQLLYTGIIPVSVSVFGARFQKEN